MHSSVSPGPSSDVTTPRALAPRFAWLALLQAVQFWQLVCLLLGLAVLIGVALALPPPSVAATLGRFGRVFGMLFAAICCLWMTRRAAPGRERVAWGCITLGVVGYVLAESVILALSLAAEAPLSPGVIA